MKIFLETERLILREITDNDKEGMFEMDSDPEVHKFLGNRPVKSIEESLASIQYIRQQYQERGIGRWALIIKDGNQFAGWCGLKYVTEPHERLINYYDLGYRLMRKHWGKGYATEGALASMDYAEKNLKLKEIFAYADINNTASNKILLKCGLKFKEECIHDGMQLNWYQKVFNSDQ